MRFSFCEGLYIPFVKHLCNVTECSLVRAQFRSSRLGEPVTVLLIGEHQKTMKTVIWGIKSLKIFWPAGAVSACGGSNAFFLISHDFAHTYSNFETVCMLLVVLYVISRDHARDSLRSDWVPTQKGSRFRQLPSAGSGFAARRGTLQGVNCK